jgi:hypothetical protein
VTAEWLTAYATLGTFVVITASAIAALLQLRHTRGSNQIIALTECRETLESEDFTQARHFIFNELPALMEDPAILRALSERTFPGQLRPVSYVANFFESMGAFVRFNIIDRSIACDLWCGVVLSCWDALVPVVRLRRRLDPGIWENFEYLAMISKRFVEKYPTSYPPDMPRMDLGEGAAPTPS